jgi:metal-sulfur cluster biosynthetic enzyme
VSGPGEAAIMEVLAEIAEPCSIAMRSPTNLRDMGLVESITIDGSRVVITLVLTDPSCVHFQSMSRYIQDAVGAMPGVENVAVLMSTTQLWTERLMRRRVG